MNHMRMTLGLLQMLAAYRWVFWIGMFLSPFLSAVVVPPPPDIDQRPPEEADPVVLLFPLFVLLLMCGMVAAFFFFARLKYGAAATRDPASLVAGLVLAHVAGFLVASWLFGINITPRILVFCTFPAATWLGYWIGDRVARFSEHSDSGQHELSWDPRKDESMDELKED